MKIMYFASLQAREWETFTDPFWLQSHILAPYTAKLGAELNRYQADSTVSTTITQGDATQYIPIVPNQLDEGPLPDSDHEETVSLEKATEYFTADRVTEGTLSKLSLSDI